MRYLFQLEVIYMDSICCQSREVYGKYRGECSDYQAVCKRAEEIAVGLFIILRQKCLEVSAERLAGVKLQACLYLTSGSVDYKQIERKKRNYYKQNQNDICYDSSYSKCGPAVSSAGYAFDSCHKT